MSKRAALAERQKHSPRKRECLGSTPRGGPTKSPLDQMVVEMYAKTMRRQLRAYERLMRLFRCRGTVALRVEHD